jgi:hypothetical protein
MLMEANHASFGPVVFGTTSVAFLCIAGSCLLVSRCLVYQELGEVNRKLSESQQISYYWWYPGKMSTIKEHYKEFYPQGRVDFWRLVLERAGILFAMLALIGSGFFDFVWKP